MKWQLLNPSHLLCQEAEPLESSRGYCQRLPGYRRLVNRSEGLIVCNIEGRPKAGLAPPVEIESRADRFGWRANTIMGLLAARGGSRQSLAGSTDF